MEGFWLPMGPTSGREKSWEGLLVALRSVCRWSRSDSGDCTKRGPPLTPSLLPQGHGLVGMGASESAACPPARWEARGGPCGWTAARASGFQWSQRLAWPLPLCLVTLWSLGAVSWARMLGCGLSVCPTTYPRGQWRNLINC